MLPEEMTTKSVRKLSFIEVLRLDAGTNQWVQVSGSLAEPKAYAGYAQIEGMIFQVFRSQLPMEFIPTKSTLHGI